jgi:hypothetical protein
MKESCPLLTTLDDEAITESFYEARVIKKPKAIVSLPVKA